ncbi:hypothetical protein RRG08_013072 [Elysia crispata]|uniref:Uncharacterized protein n=1 Tax=Elysia crispata TaxID=231223 RepID=A0AAE1A047_9GAST|nr:hypothetical protein RRG08_013072 [Elysia crispata]
MLIAQRRQGTNPCHKALTKSGVSLTIKRRSKTNKNRWFVHLRHVSTANQQVRNGASSQTFALFDVKQNLNQRGLKPTWLYPTDF